MSQVKKAPAKTTTAKAAPKAKAKTPIRRHSDELRARIVAFIKTGKSNTEAKAKFGVSAHFVGKLRKENKVAPAVVSKPAPKAKAPAPKAKPTVKAPKAAPATPADGDLL